MEDSLQKLIAIGEEIARQSDYAKLFRYVIEQSIDLLDAEGGTFYIYDSEKHRLAAVVALNHVLGMEHSIDQFEPSDINGLFTVGLAEQGSVEREPSISGECWRSQTTVVVPKVDREREFDLRQVNNFDNKHNYKSQSLVAIPLLTRNQDVLGVVQLVNPMVDLSDTKERHVALVRTLMRFMGLALENNLLLLASENLLKSVVEMVSTAIDAKSKSTGGHCHRVTELTLMLGEAMAADTTGPYRNFSMSEEEHNELRTAALLHDVGKIATPTHIMDKAHKLEGIFDKIDYLRVRHQLRHENLRVAQLEQTLRDKDIDIPEPADHKAEEADFTFLESLNIGGEFLDDEILHRLEEIADRTTSAGKLIEEEDLCNLMIKRGTLNDEERQIMQDHAAISIRLLDKLPWPGHLSEVPEIAGKHHENCDGTGYPRGLTGNQMSLRAKVLSLTDRFEGLSAPDRTYRNRKSLKQVLRIMEDMSSKNQIDPVLYQFFLDSGVCRKFVRKYLSNLDEDELPAAQTNKVVQASS